MIAQTPAGTATPTANVNDYSHNQRPTTSEQASLRALIDNLNQSGITCEIAVQQKLVIPLRKRNSDAVKSQLEALTKRFASSEFSIRQPDLFLPKYGLVIEIDGAVHDCSDARILRDNTRDAEYKTLGLNCFVIYNSQLYDSVRKSRIFNDIINLIKLEAAQPDFKKHYQRRRKAISRARREFKQINSNIDIGRHDRTSPLETIYEGVVGRNSWCGHNIRTS